MRIQHGSRTWSVALLTIVALAGCSGTGPEGQDREPEQQFREHLQVIVEAARARYGELATQAAGVAPDEPLPGDFRAQMSAQAAADRRTADEIEQLSPPESAAEPVRALVDALRERADVFAEAAARTTLTMQQLEAEGSLSGAGERIDRALRQLRAAGFLATEAPHD